MKLKSLLIIPLLVTSLSASTYLDKSGISRAILYNWVDQDHPYSGTNLTPGANLTDAFLQGSLLTNADLAGADLAGADLSGADLSGADLNGADLTGADLRYTILNGAELIEAVFTNVAASNADLTGANLTGADLTGVDLNSANLTGADLDGVNITGVKLSNADLTGANLTGVISGNITGTPTLPSGYKMFGGYIIGPGADLTGVNLTGANLDGVNLTGVVLTGANLTGVISGNITGTPTLPSGYEMFGGYIVGPSVDLTGAVLTAADLSGFDLSGADLTGVISGNITGTPTLPSGYQMVGGYIIGPGADLTGANLTGANLDGVNLTGVDLTGLISGNITGTPTLPTNYALENGYIIGPYVNLSADDLTDALGGGNSITQEVYNTVVAARDTALAAQANAETARDNALADKATAETAQANAETARDNALAGKATAETALANAETARDNALADKATAETAQANAEAERDSRPTQVAYDTVVAESNAKLTLDEVKDLRAGSTMIEVSNNEATIELEMHQSNDLQTWSKVGESISMTVPADSNTKFFRHAFSSSNSTDGSDSSDDTTLEFTFIGTNNHDFGAYYGNEAIISTANIPLHEADSNIYYTTSYEVIEWSSSTPIGGSTYGRPTVTVAQTNSLVGYNLKIRFFKYDSSNANNFSSSGPILTIDGDSLAQQEQTVLSASGIGVSSQLGYSVRVWKEAKP